MLHLRPFNPADSDYEQIVRIWNATWPERSVTVESMRTNDPSLDAQRFYQRWIVEDEAGALISFGYLCEMWWVIDAGIYKFDFATHPDYRRQGALRLFYDHMLTVLLPRQPQALQVETRLDHPDAIDFLEQRGFQVVMRKLESRLELAKFERRRFADAAQAMHQQGITLVALPELRASDPNWLQKMYELDWALLQDVPSVDARRRRTFAEFSEFFELPAFDALGWVVAVEDASGDYVGMSNIWRHKARPDVFDTGLTGVVRTHRRKGIALAMKLYITDLALRRGIRAIHTRNEEHNPMLKLNLHLGFEVLPAWLVYEKR